MPLADLLHNDNGESSSPSSGDADANANATPDSDSESDLEDPIAIEVQDSALLEDDFLGEDAQIQYSTSLQRFWIYNLTYVS